MSFLTSLIKTVSGGTETYRSEQLLYDKVIGIRGVVEGVGTSTIVHNIAAALSDTTHYHVCVLDTHMLYPTLRGLLCTQAAPAKDWFDFTADLSEVVCTTKYRNVKYIGFYYRTLIDMLSTKDCRAVLDNLMSVLKEVFDIILIDLSLEPTVVATNAAVQCNKIYTVVSPEPASMFAFKTSINTAVTTAVPAYKLRNVILNKSAGRYDTTMLDILKENKFNVMCQIPYSDEIIKYNWVGNSYWGAVTRSHDITNANNGIATIVKDIVEVTDMNRKYLVADGEHKGSIENTQQSLETMSNVVVQQTQKKPKIAETNAMSVQKTNRHVVQDGQATDTVNTQRVVNTNKRTTSVATQNVGAVDKQMQRSVQTNSTESITQNMQSSTNKRTAGVLGKTPVRKPLQKAPIDKGVADNAES